MTTWLAILYWVALFLFTGASLTLAILAWSAKSHWLIGGSDRSFALQPWSIQGQAGLNVSLAFAGLTLR